MTSKTNAAKEKVHKKISQKSAHKGKVTNDTTQQMYLTNKWGKINLQRPDKADRAIKVKNKSGKQIWEGRESLKLEKCRFWVQNLEVNQANPVQGE